MKKHLPSFPVPGIMPARAVYQESFIKGLYTWQRVLLAASIVIASIVSVRAQDVSLVIAASDSWAMADGKTSYTYPTTDVIKYLAATITDDSYSFTDFVTSTSTTAVCAPAVRRVQVNSFELELISTSASKIAINVTTSSSSGQIRVLRGILVNGVLLNPDSYQASHTFPDADVTQSTCAEVIINGLSIPKGAKVTIVFGSSPTSTPQNARINFITITPDGSLPVRLLGFNASSRSTGVELAWQVNNEVEGRSYTIERSTDGRNFNAIGTIQAAGLGNYTFVDNSPKIGKMIYYRLQLLSIDGSKSYSQINAINLGGNGELIITPNPVRGGNLFITFAPGKQQSTLRVLNASGQVIQTNMVAANAEQAVINTNNLQPGAYMVQLINGTEIQTKRFVKM